MEEKLSINPWMKIWIHPRLAMREIIDYKVNHRFYVLSWIYGFSLLLNIAQNFSLNQKLPLSLILLFSAILAVFVGMLGITVTSAILYWTGKWIGGRASYLEVRSAVAWSNVPNAVQILLWGILISMFGISVFNQGFSNTPFMGNELACVISLFFAQAVLGVWSFIILLHTLGEVQSFSAWKAILNIFIPLAILIVAMWFLGLFIF